MNAVLLAAGAGSRMRPLSAIRPKPMLPVADRPLLAHVADAAVHAGADELVIVDRQFDAVCDHFGAAYDGVLDQYVDQGEATGTAGAVAAAPVLDGPFAGLNGDNLYDQESIADLFASGPVVGVHEVDDPTSYGVVSVDGDRITDVVEKPAEPPTTLANTGAYVFPASTADWLDVPVSERGERELTDVLARTIAATDVAAVESTSGWTVAIPGSSWLGTRCDSTRSTRTVVETSIRMQTLHGAVTVEAVASIFPGTVIEGPVLVREGATVGPNAYVLGSTVIGPDARVGSAVEVENSVLMAGATVPHLSSVGDSVLGRDVNLGVGTTVANLRHDGEDVRLTVKGERVSTGRRRFGVVLGAGAKTGIDASLSPGIVLDVSTTTMPGEVVSRDKWRDKGPIKTAQLEPNPR